MSVDEPATAAEFEIGIREPGRRYGLVLLWLVLVGGSIWLFVATPHDLATLLMIVAFVLAGVVMLVWRTYLTLRPRVARLDDLGITIRYPGADIPARIRWPEIETAELQTVPEPQSRIARHLMSQTYERRVRGQAVLLRLRRAYGPWRWMKVPFIGMPHSRTVYLSVVDAPRFVEMANEHLTHERKVRVDRPT
ncbi:MAG: hypothetical protein WD379_08335 [Dehalococcoidia bacterium]